MSNIYELTYSALSTSNFPVVKHGSYKKGDTVPDTFITYSVISSRNDTHYDNLPASTTYRIQVTVYSRSREISQEADELMKSLLLPAGFLRMGGRDLPNDSNTGHEAYTSDYNYFKYEEN